MSDQTPSTELLPFEKQNFHGTYRQFFADKRGSFFNTVKAFAPIWDAFQLLDEVWSRELNDLSVPSSPTHILPGVLFYAAHANIRMAFELGFSRRLSDARGVMRSGIESVAFARNFLQKPQLVSQLMSQQSSAHARRRAFKRAFASIRKQLFPKKCGLDRLHRSWQRFSDAGAHSTMSSLAAHLTGRTSSHTSEISFRYVDADKPFLHSSLSDLLVCGVEMERLFFMSFKDRLELDSVLFEMRARLTGKWKVVFAGLITAPGIAEHYKNLTSQRANRAN